MAHQPDSEIIRSTRNTARYFTETRQVSWVLLIVVILWGFFSYRNIPKQKDPAIPVRMASIVTPWPGATAEDVEQLVTRQVEQTVAQSTAIHAPEPTAFGIKSLSLPGVSILKIQLAGSINDTEKQFSDINLKLNAINDQLPAGAGPIQVNSDFGQTSALMLTVASPKEKGVELELRARQISAAIRRIREAANTGSARRTSLLVAFPRGIESSVAGHVADRLRRFLQESRFATDVRSFSGTSFLGIDAVFNLDNAVVLAELKAYLHEKMGMARLHPDAWKPVFIANPDQALEKLRAADGDKYSYSQLDNFTDLLSRNIQTIPQVSKVQRSGVQNEQVYLAYSQERLAQYGVVPANIVQILSARNTTVPGGMLQVGGMGILVEPSGQFTDVAQIGDVIVRRNQDGLPLYLRELVDIHRGYQSPPRLLNFHTWQDQHGDWHRSRAISLAIMMRQGDQINEFGNAVDVLLKQMKTRIPDDLIMHRTSDQPRQTSENIDLFMTALYEAILLVVVVAVIGFREWRSALLLMISIPVTLAMTFGMIYMLGIELQQISIATLIIALGLLVDDPVVAGDAIKRGLADGQPRGIAAWLGPTRLSRVIMYATVTNVVAYIPFLLLSGNTGDFLYSLPVVMGCALGASRLVSMTFVPFLGYYLLRPESRPTPTMAYRRAHGFSGWYYRTGRRAIAHRKRILLCSLLILFCGAFLKAHLKNSFFPDDVQYLSYVDIWLKNDASIFTTDSVSRDAEAVIRRATAEYERDSVDDNAKPAGLLESLSTYVGGSAPRFWFTVTPNLQQANYAQVIIRVTDRDKTPDLVPLWQQALSAQIPGAWLDVRQLQTNPVKYPLEIRISGRATIDPSREQQDIRTLRALAAEVVSILRSTPLSARARDDWGMESFALKMRIDTDVANFAGMTNQDVALSSQSAISGIDVATLREGNLQIPVVTRMWPEQIATLADLNNLYVYANEDTSKVPLSELANLDYVLETQRIRRLEQFRTVSVIAYPVAGAIASEVFDAVREPLAEFAKKLPLGYHMAISGEQGHTVKGFHELIKVMGISAAAIFLALVLQFRNAFKPVLVFAAVPYGMVGSLCALYLMGSPFSYMAFLGIVALIGVIVSHVIVLFDFIDERQEQGEDFIDAVLDAGIIRLRPVMITVAATVLALFPLALHGGPLWQPLCYAQIGGLLFATVITLLLVPVLYSVFVLDLKLIRWERPDPAP